MCGIVGYYGNIGFRDKLTEALGCLSHRGPDDSGVEIFENAGLGHARLSIIDLSPAGHQPMYNSDKSIVLTFNGEIYNFLEIRKQLQRKYDFVSKTDSEVIIHAYEEWGTSCLEKFTGMFSFVIYDRKKDLLFGARDRLGEKPLRYYEKDGQFVFASENKAIIKFLDSKPAVDLEAVDDYLTYQYVPAPRTGFRDIYKLPPAHYFVYQNGKLTVEKYWDMDYSKKLNLSEEEWQERILFELDKVVKERLISDVPIGAFLSGGVDSGALTAYMARNSKGRIKTFSMGFDDPKYDETTYAKKVAQIYDTEHYTITTDSKSLMSSFETLFSFYDEPIADDSILPSYLLSEFTRGHVTVALNGDGGDENFAGYSRYNVVALSEQFENIPSSLRKILFDLPAEALNSLVRSKLSRRAEIFFSGLSNPFYKRYVDYNGIFTDDDKKALLSQSFLEQTRSHISYELYKSFCDPKLSNLDNALNIDLHTYLPENLLYKTDTASMAHALELRSPMLDHKFVELFAQMPTKYKLRNGNKKYLFKKALVAKGILPGEVVYRRKMGFSLPLDTWFGDDLKHYAKEQSLNPILWESGIFDKKKLENFVEGCYESSFNQGKSIFSLICLSKWLQRYIKN